MTLSIMSIIVVVLAFVVAVADQLARAETIRIQRSFGRGVIRAWRAIPVLENHLTPAEDGL